MLTIVTSCRQALVAFVKDGSIYLSANGANAALLDEEQDGTSAD